MQKPLRQRVYYLTIANLIVGAVESMPVLAVTRIGRYYRTTVPREVRKLLGLNENDKVSGFSRMVRYLLGRGVRTQWL
jgi:hypothetical protein